MADNIARLRRRRKDIKSVAAIIRENKRKEMEDDY